MKTFVSIGTGPGIGFATAERFAREGFRIILTARNLERTTGLAQRFRRKALMRKSTPSTPLTLIKLSL
ncbi:hypothetical protein ROSI111154_24480 [Rouxiella silvae]|jgi:NAD(P)-dependent dehydrogenase (short-subunit alcohol dehydrogenase family)